MDKDFNDHLKNCDDNDDCDKNCGDCEYAMNNGGLDALKDLLMYMEFIKIINKISSLQQSIALLGEGGNDYLIKEFDSRNLRKSIHTAGELFKQQYPDIDAEAIKTDTLLLLNSILHYLKERNPVIDGLDKF